MTPHTKNPHAVALGRLGGRIGGLASSPTKGLMGKSAEERSAIARKGVANRLAKTPEERKVIAAKARETRRKNKERNSLQAQVST